MTSMNDEVLFATLIELADTTTTGFDLVSLADRLVGACVEVLGVTAAGIMLADQRKSLRVFASSNEETRILELLELQNNDGPCLEAFRTGTPIEGTDLSRFTTRWPRFTAAAMSAGFNTAYAVPMRLRDQTIGALNLFQAGSEPLGTHKVSVARVLADMAAIGIINHWSLRQQEVLAQQLQSALNTRVIIEQAKGVVAERQGISLGEAFEYLRSTARSTQRPIADVAIETVSGRGHTVSARPSGPATTPPRARPPANESAASRPPQRATDGSGRASSVIRHKLSGGPRLVGLRERAVDLEPRAAHQVETALELVRAVYSVNPDDALDLLSEASHDLNCSLPDVAVQVLSHGRLPEEAILRARIRQQRTPSTEEVDPARTDPPALRGRVEVRRSPRDSGSR